MNEIKNYDVYNQRMSKTLYDKCWWIDKIDDNIDVIIDYGCGDGSLFKMINRIRPNKFEYIGIDNDDNMLRIAKQNIPCGTFYKSIDELSRYFSYPANLCSDNIVFVMNSVMHEVFTYLNKKEQCELFTTICQKLNPKYIAIRDMYINEDDDLHICFLPYLQDIDDNIKNSKYTEIYKSYADSKSADHHARLFRIIDHYTEFFLKYTYEENWEREKNEVYLWDWMKTLDKYFYEKYTVEFENKFYIPFICQRIQNDFDLNWYVNTHKKVLYKLS